MRWPWTRSERVVPARSLELDEQARLSRGLLAEAVVRNDRVRHRLAMKTKEAPVSAMLSELFEHLDEARRD